ncbi:MAG: hypothetical protein JWO39_1598 [Gemmatimonadetes bacterium]|jgi:hypothetical protein|nr:hypothetical protein [Gemmatimonadota bacterium]
MPPRTYGACRIEAGKIDLWPNEARVRIMAPRDAATGQATGRHQIQGISAWVNASDESRITQEVLMEIWKSMFANQMLPKVSITWYTNEAKGANVLANLEFQGSLTGYEFFNPGNPDSDITDGPAKGGMSIIDHRPDAMMMSNILVIQFAATTTDTGYGSLRMSK